MVSVMSSAQATRPAMKASRSGRAAAVPVVSKMASSSVAPTRRAALAPTRRSSSAAPAPATTPPLTPPPSALALAPALDLAPQASALSDADRAGLAEALGYRTIGAELPSDVSLTDVIKSMPSSVFDINPWRAWGAVATTVAAVAFSAFLIQNSPWYLLPLAWAFAGTAWTGMFVIGHDCGHRSFSHNKLVEDIVGTIAFMPLIYPFEPWRIKHNHHHAHTNKLVEDTAWHPVPKSDVEKWGPVQGALYKFFLGSPLKLWASVGHWAIWHFNLDLYTEKQRPRVLVSLAACALFAFVGIPAICHLGGGVGHGGVTAVLKHWLAPWLGYHFWMSTFTVVHHTAPHIPFKPAGEWNAAKAQLSGTVHCDYPALVEFLCHDINVHVPHHVSSKIPWYNLRAATDSLRSNWGKYMTEGSWNWRMMKSIFTECHVYDESRNYAAFDDGDEEPFFAVQRRLLPETM